MDEPQQDITSRLVQLSTSSTTDPQGCAGRPNINPEGPWQQYPSPNSVSSFDPNETVHCYKCGILGHYSNQCSRKAWCDKCNKDNHATAYCHSKNKPVNTSTQKMPTQEVPQTSMHNTSIQSSNDLLQTKIELDAKTKTRKKQNEKDSKLRGTNRERCLTWLEHNRTAAKDVGIPLREALLDTAHGTVYEVISATDSNMSDRELTQHVLETFSDIQTSEDAIRKLKLVRRGVEPLVTYNNKYTAIHLVAYGIDPKLQMMEQAWRTYANTLDKDLARRLNKFITYQMDKDSNRREVHSLFDVMEKVKKLEKQERKHKQYSGEKTTIDLPINIPVPDEDLRKLQEQDKETRRLIDLFNSGKIDKKLYSMDNYILKRVLIEDGIMYYPVVLPDLLRDCVLMLAHDKQGHNDALRVYNFIRRLYYWKGMKKQIRSHCSRCITCAKFNTKAQEFVKKHFTSPLQPMEFISMDLIGEFSPPSSQGHRYALTAVCMLTCYTWCIPLKEKPATEVVNAYIDNIYCLFGPSK